MKPRSAPLAAVEDLDRDHEGGYAVPRDTVTPGTKVKYLYQGRVCSTKRHFYTGYQGKVSGPGKGMQYLETLLHWVPRYRIWTRAGCAVPRDTVTPCTKV